MSFNDASKRLDIALESLFDAEQTTAAMLDKVRTNVANTVCSIEDARVLENKLSEEAAQFNECLTTMSEAIRKYEAGNISSDDMLAECTPCVTALRERCVALKLSGVKVTGNDITEEEIATLREFIVGCKDIVAERVEELQDCCGEEGCEHEGAQESILGNMLFGDPRAAAIRNSPELKTANELYKQAKKLYGVGNKERAQECLAKAKKIYEAKYALAVKEARMVTSTRKGTTWNSNAKISDEYKKKVTENASLGAIVLYLEDKVDSCTALKMQWENKAGKNSYAETKAQLKAERVEERKKYRAAKKAEKEKGKNMSTLENLSFLPEEGALHPAVESYIVSMEAFLDDCDAEFYDSYAMEAAGDEGEPVSKGSKLRGLLARFKKEKAEGDDAAAARTDREIREAADDIVEEAETAETEPEVKKSNKNIVIALGALAALTAAIGVGVYVGKRKGANMTGEEKAALNKSKEITGLAKKIADAPSKITNSRAARAVKARAAEVTKNVSDWAAKQKTKAGEKKYDRDMEKRLKAFGGSTKAERRQAVVNARDEKNVAKARGSMDSMTFLDDETELSAGLETFVCAMESFLDECDTQYTIDYALEAAGEEGEATSKGSKLRGLLARFKKEKAEGDDAAAARTDREIRETADELVEEANTAETEPEVKKSNKNIVIALGALAALTAAIGVGAYVRKKKGASAGAAEDQKTAKEAKDISDLAKLAQKQINRATNSRLAKIVKGKAAAVNKNVTTWVATTKEKAGEKKYDRDMEKRLKAFGGSTKAERRQAVVNARDEKNVAKARGSMDSMTFLDDDQTPSVESLLFGLESVLDDDFGDDDDFATGKGFDGADFDVDDDDADELATEAMVAMMLAEDGLED